MTFVQEREDLIEASKKAEEDVLVMSLKVRIFSEISSRISIRS
jgi:hypothetical protein